ncbi:hypothetical protein C1T17_00130 [Sphingobium sp. SCG-1]|nr:hypothetical protein C1T17_00130 [Sphingobium sp. SCG-1]
MAVAVMFPDGTIRNVIGELKLEGGRFVQSPINCDPRWKYIKQSGVWTAQGRHGQVHMMPLADRRCWWHSIPQMSDDVAEAPNDRAITRSVA